MRVLLFSERLRPPFDEGFKNTAIQLARALRQSHSVALLTTFGESIAAEGISNIASNKLLLSRRLRRAVRDFRPEVVLYLPTASATPAAMLRTRVLTTYAAGARTALLALQPRTYSAPARLALRLLRPRLILAQSQAMVQTLAALGCRVRRMSSGVDAERFMPATPEQRLDLRRALGLSPEAFVVLHVGHINGWRNLRIMERLQKAGCQAVVVGSTSTEQDERLGGDLQAAGVHVVYDFQPHIERYYQAADCYVFPVVSDTGAIAVPLSVLEAMACDTPVVTTPYGDLPLLLRAGPGLRFAKTDKEIVQHTLAMRGVAHPGTRSQALPFNWPAVAGAILRDVMTHLP